MKGIAMCLREMSISITSIAAQLRKLRELKECEHNKMWHGEDQSAHW